MDRWINAYELNPTTWANTNWLAGRKLEGRYRVRLSDGREIFTWWQDGQWSVERLKPHLKVALWKEPIWIA